MDLRTGEGIALPVSFVVMIIVFGGFVAAGMPIAGAVASIAGALASLLGFSYLIDLDTTAVNVVTVLGLGLCIDYGLLVVSRFREELRARAQGMPAAEIPVEMIRAAAARTVDSAGRTVVFSGLTVAISLGGALASLSTILVWIGVALFIALALDPIVHWLESHKISRALSIVIVFVGFAVALGGLLAWIIPSAVTQITEFAAAVPGYITNLQQSEWFTSLVATTGQSNLAQTVLDQARSWLSDPANLLKIVDPHLFRSGVVGAGQAQLGARHASCHGAELGSYINVH